MIFATIFSILYAKAHNSATKIQKLFGISKYFVKKNITLPTLSKIFHENGYKNHK